MLAACALEQIEPQQTSSDQSAQSDSTAFDLELKSGSCSPKTITPQNKSKYNEFTNARYYTYSSYQYYDKKSKKTKTAWKWVQDGDLVDINFYPTEYAGDNNTEDNWMSYLKKFTNTKPPYLYSAPSGNCTFFAFCAAAAHWGIDLPLNLRDASKWHANLLSSGYTSSDSYIKNAVVSFRHGKHVAFSEDKNDCYVLVSEMNYQGILHGYGKGMRYQQYPEDKFYYLTPPPALASEITCSYSNGNISGSFDLKNVSPIDWTGPIYLSINTDKNKYIDDLYNNTLSIPAGEAVTINYSKVKALKSGKYILVAKTTGSLGKKTTYPALPQLCNTDFNSRIVTF